MNKLKKKSTHNYFRIFIYNGEHGVDEHIKSTDAKCFDIMVDAIVNFSLFLAHFLLFI